MLCNKPNDQTLAAFAVLATATLAQDCAYYYRLDGTFCADDCIPGTVGLCPRSLIVSKGNLTAGQCKDQGYTVAAGTQDQLAGPCGKLHFKKYSKSVDSPHITCKTASGAPQVPCTSEFDSCCDGVPGVGQSCYASATQDCCTDGPGKGHVCPKGKCSTRQGFFCD